MKLNFSRLYDLLFDSVLFGGDENASALFCLPNLCLVACGLLPLINMFDNIIVWRSRVACWCIEIYWFILQKAS